MIVFIASKTRDKRQQTCCGDLRTRGGEVHIGLDVLRLPSRGVVVAFEQESALDFFALKHSKACLVCLQGYLPVESPRASVQMRVVSADASGGGNNDDGVLPIQATTFGHGASNSFLDGFK